MLCYADALSALRNFTQVKVAPIPLFIMFIFVINNLQHLWAHRCVYRQSCYHYVWKNLKEDIEIMTKLTPCQILKPSTLIHSIYRRTTLRFFSVSSSSHDDAVHVSTCKTRQNTFCDAATQL